jgi:predicted transcriptional regulator
MQALIDDNKLKDLMKQAIIEAIEEKKDMVQELLAEALEDVAMIHAIKDGEDSGLVERDEIFGILSGSKGSA